MLAFIVAGGCAVGFSACATSSPIIVRMARPGEFEPRPQTTAPGHYASVLEVAMHAMDPCPVAGPLAPYLFEPVVEFARRNLISRVDHFGVDASTRTYTWSVGPNDREPPRRVGIVIAVQPRAQLGQLDVGNWWNDGANTLAYCLHVRRDGHTITVVVSYRTSVISLSPPARPRLASDP